MAKVTARDVRQSVRRMRFKSSTGWGCSRSHKSSCYPSQHNSFGCVDNHHHLLLRKSCYSDLPITMRDACNAGARTLTMRGFAVRDMEKGAVRRIDRRFIAQLVMRLCEPCPKHPSHGKMKHRARCVLQNRRYSCSITYNVTSRAIASTTTTINTHLPAGSCPTT